MITLQATVADSMPLFVVTFGGVLVCFGAAFLVLAYRIERWPTVPGIITESHLRELSRSELRERGYRFYRKVYETEIAYDYIVRGFAYRGRGIGYGMVDFFERSPAEARVATYPVGRAVRVAFKPADPRDAFLERGYTRRYAWVCLTVGAAMIIGGWRSGFALGAR